MSLMQKAIRRGREEIALRAAATLLRDSPDRLWRRCGVTAFEDIGVADLDLWKEYDSEKSYRVTVEAVRKKLGVASKRTAAERIEKQGRFRLDRGG